jgi:hypothetical protein
MVNPTRKREGDAQNFRRAIPAEPLLSTPRKTSRHIDCSHSSLNGKTRQLSKDYHIRLHALTIQAETLPVHYHHLYVLQIQSETLPMSYHIRLYVLTIQASTLLRLSAYMGVVFLLIALMYPATEMHRTCLRTS